MMTALKKTVRNAEEAKLNSNRKEKKGEKKRGEMH